MSGEEKALSLVFFVCVDAELSPILRLSLLVCVLCCEEREVEEGVKCATTHERRMLVLASSPLASARLFCPARYHGGLPSYLP